MPGINSKSPGNGMSRSSGTASPPYAKIRASSPTRPVSASQAISASAVPSGGASARLVDGLGAADGLAAVTTGAGPVPSGASHQRAAAAPELSSSAARPPAADAAYRRRRTLRRAAATPGGWIVAVASARSLSNAVRTVRSSIGSVIGASASGGVLGPLRGRSGGGELCRQGGTGTVQPGLDGAGGDSQLVGDLGHGQ